MMVLGLILLLLDLLLLHTGIIWIIGLLLLIVGAVFWFVPVGGTRRRYY